MVETYERAGKATDTDADATLIRRRAVRDFVRDPDRAIQTPTIERARAAERQAREEALAESRQELELSATSELYCERCDRLTAQSVTFIQAAPPGGAGGKCVDVRRARCKECGLRTRT